ncbi:uncharacterized protein METZ01_LOCUS246223, partial [marine metagenome]
MDGLVTASISTRPNQTGYSLTLFGDYDTYRNPLSEIFRNSWDGSSVG